MGRLPRNTRKRETHESARHTKPAFLFLFFVVFVGVARVARGADGSPDLTVTPIVREGHVVVSFDLSDGYTPDVRDAIHSGLLTTFSYELDLRRGAALFDRTVASVTVTAVVRFDNLTRRYQMWRTVDGRVEDARPTESRSREGLIERDPFSRKALRCSSPRRREVGRPTRAREANPGS